MSDSVTLVCPRYQQLLAESRQKLAQEIDPQNQELYQYLSKVFNISVTTVKDIIPLVDGLVVMVRFVQINLT